MKYLLQGALLCVACAAATNTKAQLVINEVDYDQPGTDNAEFIEILNTGSSAFPLQYLQVALVNGNAGGNAVYATLENVSWPALPAGSFFVICANAATSNCNAVVPPATNLIQNGSPDAIALVITQPEPLVLDALSYGGGVPVTPKASALHRKTATSRMGSALAASPTAPIPPTTTPTSTACAARPAPRT
jgi:hypothetical protein